MTKAKLRSTLLRLSEGENPQISRMNKPLDSRSYSIPTATMTYLSGDTTIGTKPSSSPLGMGPAPEANGLGIKYRELAPGIVEGSYSLEHLHVVQFFLFVLEGTLGHATYL